MSKVNSQSQCGVSSFNHSYGAGYPDGVRSYPPSVEKKVKLRLKVKEHSNGQIQGQIVEADFLPPTMEIDLARGSTNP